MTLKREDIKKLVIQQMLQESIQEEGVEAWARQLFKKFKGTPSSTSQQGASSAQASKKPLDFNKKLELVSDFIQMNRDSKSVKDSDLGKMLFSANPLQEAYESQLLKLMKDKKIDEKDVDLFITQMSKNTQAKKQLIDLGLIGDDKQSQQQAQAGSETKTTTQTVQPTQPVRSAEERPISTSQTIASPPSKTLTTEPPTDVKVSGNNITTDSVNIQVKAEKDKGARKPSGEAKVKANQKAKSLADLLNLQKQGKLKDPEKTQLINILSGMSAEARAKLEEHKYISLKEALVEEIFNLLTGKIK